jgi:hypothetical protein
MFTAILGNVDPRVSEHVYDFFPNTIKVIIPVFK